MATETRPGEEAGENGARRDGGIPGLGLIKGLLVTLRHLMSRSITQQYPHEKPDLPPRTRGVIALKPENCTVCWKCSRECPDWCIYIESHKETHQPASGGRARSAKVLDRFAIDYALCMYCGICVEVCPFDALFWSPEFEYATYGIQELTHEKEKLSDWTYTVLPPPELEEGAIPAPDETETDTQPPTSATPVAEPGSATPQASSGGATSAPPTGGASASASGTEGVPSAATSAPPSGAAEAAPEATPLVAEGEADAAASESVAGVAPAAEHVEPDQETHERVLQEELAKGTDRRVAEGRAKAAAIRAARSKAQEGGG
jgi:formate hydrogenlyase subunit 6/NADH:ubiquinone oxidoreductase subunit I